MTLETIALIAYLAMLSAVLGYGFIRFARWWTSRESDHFGAEM